MKRITVAGIGVEIRRSARARRMTLRVSRSDGAAVLTLPPRSTEAEARAFAESKAGWLARVTAAMPGPQPVAEGALLPVEGRPLRLTPAHVRRVTPEAGALLYPATRPAGVVVAVWLRHLAQARLMVAVDRHTGRLGRPARAITLRDTRSRWGSCTSDGRLMFSWRLAMAPPAVLDYVAAHEVAHLRHMDHSPAFWATVAELFPDYPAQRAWLRAHGGGLQGWRFRGESD